jgi:hypothetical protein
MVRRSQQEQGHEIPTFFHAGTRNIDLTHSDIIVQKRFPCHCQPHLFPMPILPHRRRREQHEPVAIVHTRHTLDECEFRGERHRPVAHLQCELPHAEREPRGVVEHVVWHDPAVRVAQREATEHTCEHGCAAGHEEDVGDVEGCQAQCLRRDECDCGRDGVGKDVSGIDVEMAQPWEARFGWVARRRVVVKGDEDARRVEAER